MQDPEHTHQWRWPDHSPIGTNPCEHCDTVRLEMLDGLPPKYRIDPTVKTRWFRTEPECASPHGHLWRGEDLMRGNDYAPCLRCPVLRLGDVFTVDAAHNAQELRGTCYFCDAPALTERGICFTHQDRKKFRAFLPACRYAREHAVITVALPSDLTFARYKRDPLKVMIAHTNYPEICAALGADPGAVERDFLDDLCTEFRDFVILPAIRGVVAALIEREFAASDRSF